MNHDVLLIVFLIVIALNVITFAMYGIDKRKAVKHKWRISEATLIGMAFAYGGIGALLGMHLFKHKTKHTKFIILVPIAVGLEIIITIWLIYKFW